jgi:hypothetical protein
MKMLRLSTILVLLLLTFTVAPAGGRLRLWNAGSHRGVG